MRISRKIRTICLAGVIFSISALLLFVTLYSTEEEHVISSGWKTPNVKIPDGIGHPRVACSKEELERLRNAWKNGTPSERKVIYGIIKRADSAIKGALTFPPRGGQHNQWYQCDKCQTALKTIDATHHKCPICETIYSGPPYDDVIFSRRHYRNLRRMLAAAWGWAITGNRKYAEFTRSVLMGYAKRYSDYPFHGNSKNIVWNRVSGGHLFEQTLNEASAMTLDFGPAYDLVYDSPVFNDADRREIRDGLFLSMLRNIDKYKAGVGNWQTWHNAAMFIGGAVIGDESWMCEAILGKRLGFYESLVSRAANIEANRLNQVGNSFIFQMSHSVTGDGMWFEGSWGYHFYALSALVATAEAAHRLDIDLWSYPGMREMFTLPLNYAMPDGTLPRFSDDVRSTCEKRDSLFAPAYAAYKDPVLLNALSNIPSKLTIMYGRDPSLKAPSRSLKSVVFKEAGHAILRTSGKAGLVTAVTFGPYGGYHGHLDKLSFVLFGFGRELGVDPGRAKSQAYRLPIHREWYKSTISHNAVLVDFQPQDGVAGKLLGFAAVDNFAILAVETNNAYSGVEHKRFFVQTPEYLLVFDLLDSKSLRTYTFVYHNRGNSVRCANVEMSAVSALDPPFPGSEYIKNIRTGIAPKKSPLKIRFEYGDVRTCLWMAPSPGETNVVIGDGVGGSTKERVPLTLISHRKRGFQTFATLLAPELKQDGKQPFKDLKVSLAGNVGDSHEICISCANGGIDLVVLKGDKARLSRDGTLVLEMK